VLPQRRALPNQIRQMQRRIERPANPE
jgi:hypothetical protein